MENFDKTQEFDEMENINEFWKNYKCCPCPTCGESENIARYGDDCYCEECNTIYSPHPKNAPCDK